jgi:hypothetical protein
MLHAYPPVWPYQVRLRCVQLTSYRFLQTLTFTDQRPCDSDCLPPGRGDACFFQQAGFARYAGQTTKSPGLVEAGAFCDFPGRPYGVFISQYAL